MDRTIQYTNHIVQFCLIRPRNFAVIVNLNCFFEGAHRALTTGTARPRFLMLVGTISKLIKDNRNMQETLDARQGFYY